MYIAVIKRSVIIFLIAGCSPEHKSNTMDNNTINEAIAVDETLTLDEAELAKEREKQVELLDKELQLSVKNQRIEHEKQLLQNANNIQDSAETQLLKTQKEETMLAEEALLENAKSRANNLITQ
ncbi:hypothetical protein [Colwellia polaris]|jgi:hypothetical protein|uniref:hypothetical protein n=1 Tax=Colwellia polaris TaxID=326537 RepID=UPI000A17499D|nr:hypothetical protein [Colwellia polaris]|tara:strand:+ start:14014 stop:14385 length:372 start_codon:yes stop_codon:yes gene_type:complete